MSALFYRLSSVLSQSAAFAVLYTVFATVKMERVVYPGTYIWLPAVGLCSIALEFFLRKERPVRHVIILCAVFFAAQTVAVFLVYRFFAPFTGILIAMLMWLYGYYKCYELSTVKVSSESLVAVFDLGIVALIFALFFCSVGKISFNLTLPLLFSLFLSLLALVHRRSSGKGRRQNGATVLAASLAGGFALVSLVFVLAASSMTKAAIDWLWQGILQLLHRFAHAVNALLLFILSLFPQPEQELIAPEMESIPGIGGEMQQQIVLIPPEIIIYGMLGLVFAILAAWLIYSFIKGGKRVSLGSMGGSRGIRRQRKSLFAAIKLWLSSRYARLRFFILSLKNYNSAPGLLLWLEHRRGKRLENESCREYLCRLSKQSPEDGEALMVLADALDRCYFGTYPDLSSKEAAALRRRLKH